MISMKKQILEAALASYSADILLAEVNLNAYLSASTAIAEHPDLMSEVIALINKITELEDRLSYTKNLLARTNSKPF